jgi:RNA polymerase sigma-70 factor (ECF subfamily)
MGMCPVGAAIVMTSLNIALQTQQAKPYDTDSPYVQLRVATVPIDEPGPSGLESTFDLVQRAKAGDRAALDRLFTRCLPALRRWASGRLPRWTRDLMDTDDLVQETAVRAVNRLGSFEPRHEGALQAYLRQAVMNRIRDEVRRSARGPMSTELTDNQQDVTASPLDEAIGKEAVERYEAALARLRPEERAAIITRVEMDEGYDAVAEALGKPSPDAARMAVTRALVRLAQEMNRGV